MRTDKPRIARGKAGRRIVAAARALPLWLAAVLGGCRLYEPPRYEPLQLAEGAAPTRVLFIGNSLTYYNDLPGLVQQLSAGEAKPVQFDSQTMFLASLEYHWSRGKALRKIQTGHWDYVVLQDYSRRPVTDPQNSEKYFALFDAQIRRSGARTIIFENWTRRGMDDEYDAMLDAYRLAQDQTHAALAPIGLAWHICRREHPEIPLLLDDRHPTDAGTYLTACILYGVIYGKDPVALPMHLRGPDLPPVQITQLRTIATEALHQTGSPPPTPR